MPVKGAGAPAGRSKPNIAKKGADNMAIKTGMKFDNFTVVRTKSEYNKVFGHYGRIMRAIRRNKWHHDKAAHQRFNDMMDSVGVDNDAYYEAFMR